MRHLSEFAAAVGLSLAVIGTAPIAAAPNTDTPRAGAGSSECAATTDAQKLAVARAWHEEVVNRRNPAALRDILAPDMVHHAAGGRPGSGSQPVAVDGAGVSAMMSDLLRAFPDLSYTSEHFMVDQATQSELIRFRDSHPSLAGGELRRASTSFQHGMAARIAERLETMHREREVTVAAQRPAGTALITLRHQTVADAFTKTGIRLSSVPALAYRRDTAFRAGLKAGQRVNLKRPVRSAGRELLG